MNAVWLAAHARTIQAMIAKKTTNRKKTVASAVLMAGPRR
jgi:hypothetical protein